jgi:hypothetical protein
MTVAPVVNDKILVEVDGYAVYEYFANNITYGPATGALSTGSIQLAIDTLESGKMPKTGGTFTGTVVGLTPATASNDTTIPTTAFVKNALNVGTGTTYTHSISGSAAYATSAGNATQAGGLNVHADRNNEANKIVRTDVNGYIQAGYINSTNGDENNASSPARVWGTNGGDSYLRSYQTGSLSVGYAGSAGSATNAGYAGYAGSAGSATNAGYATSAGSATNAGYATSAGYASSAGNAVYATDSGRSYNYTQSTNQNWNTDFATTPPGSTVLRGDTQWGSYTGGPGGTWWFQQNMRHTNTSNVWGVQVAWGWEDNANILRTRNVQQGNYGGWVTYINSTNIGSQSVAYAGSAGSSYSSTNAGYAAGAGYASSAGSASSSYSSTNAGYSYSSYSSSNASYAGEAGYSYYGRKVYNDGAYSGSGWTEPSDLGVRYAGSAGSAGYAGYAGSAGYAGYAGSAGYAAGAGYASSAGSVGVPASGGIGSIAQFYCDYGDMADLRPYAYPGAYIDYQGGTVDIPGSTLWRVNTPVGSPWIYEAVNGGSSIIYWYEPYPLSASIRLQNTDIGTNFNPSVNRTLPQTFAYLGLSYLISRPEGTWRSLQPLRKHGWVNGSTEDGGAYGFIYRPSAALFIRIS